ncbi:galactose oxidase-like domain-containing protein [Streptomyces sp. SAS_276]
MRRGLYSPPHLFHGTRPALAFRGRTGVDRGTELTLGSANAADIERIRLMRPGSAAHAADFDQRSVALKVVCRTGTSLIVQSPDAPSLAPPGWQMTVAAAARRTPPKALWLPIR